MKCLYVWLLLSNLTLATMLVSLFGENRDLVDLIKFVICLFLLPLFIAKSIKTVITIKRKEE